jgi:2-(1,2-epoxy-1,2-dihydrophenyl)acetyl-CoA isomerase
MDYECLLFRTDGAIATITLNRPDRLNALNVRIGVELLDALDRCRDGAEIRCVVLTGAGRAFCAGDDLKQGTGFSERAARAGADARPGSAAYDDVVRAYVAGEGRWPRIVAAIRSLPKPVIAMINGYAFGAGFNIALACDFRIAAESASLATPFVRRGMATGVNLLHQYVGIGVAARMVLTGEPVGAAEAERLGLVTRVVPDHQLTEATRALADDLAQAATAALGFTKHALYEGWPLPPAQAYELQGYAVHQSSWTEDRAEGQRAFLERRPPVFQGR